MDIMVNAYRLSTADNSFSKKFSHKIQGLETNGSWDYIGAFLEEMYAQVTYLGEHAVLINGVKYPLEKCKVCGYDAYYYTLKQPKGGWK